MGVCVSVIPEGARGSKLFRKFLKQSRRSNSVGNSRHSTSPSGSRFSAAEHISERIEHLSEQTYLQLETLLSKLSCDVNSISPVFFKYHEFDGASEFTKNVVDSCLPPEGQNLESWLLLHALCFVQVFQCFHELISSHHCSTDSCPLMSAGHQFEYRWRDIETGDVLSVGAPTYIRFLFDWSVMLSEDQNKGFSGLQKEQMHQVAAELTRRLFRTYAHVFHEHYGQICQSGLSSQFDARLIHLSHFALRQKLITAKELLPMRLFFTGKVRSALNADANN